jgi:Na+/phosphate symporter
MKTANLIISLARTTERLGEIISGENSRLNDRRPQDLVRSQDEKDRLTTAYERHMGELQRNPMMLKRADPHEVDRLRNATRRFQEALDEHRRLVQTAKSITDRMIKSITDEIANRERPVTGYDATAMMKAATRRDQGAVSLALNQVV